MDPHSSVCKCCIARPVNESPKSFCMWAVFWSRTELWEILKQGTASILDLVFWFFPVPHTELTVGKKKETSFGFSHLKSIVTLQHFSVLPFTFFFLMSYCKWLVYTVQVTLVAVLNNIGALSHLISYTPW